MQSDSDHGPLYIYNGPANLQELERVNLTGARIFFNGLYSLRDVRNVNFMGATVFLNGQQTVTSSFYDFDSKLLTTSTQSPLPPPRSRSRSRSRSPARHTSPQRRQSDYYRPHDDLYRPRGEHPQQKPRYLRGGRERKRRRSEDVSKEENSTERIPEPSSSAAASQPSTTRLLIDCVKHESGRLSPYEDRDLKDSDKSATLSAVGEPPMPEEAVSQLPAPLRPWLTEKKDFLPSPENCARTTQSSNLQGSGQRSDKGVAGLSLASPSKTAERMRIDSINDSGLSEKANSLASEELNLRLKKRVLANLGRNSLNENAKIKQLSAERHRIESQLQQQQSGIEAASASSLQRPGQIQQASLLPQESPLKNVMNFAKIEEEIVQMKVQYGMAEKQLRRERQAVGRASDGIIGRVKAIGKSLAELYEQRDATQTHRSRNGAFLRPTIKNEPASPSSALISTPVVNLVSSAPAIGSEGSEIRDNCPARQPTPIEDTNVVERGKTPETVSRNPRFALTEIETFVEP